MDIDKLINDLIIKDEPTYIDISSYTILQLLDMSRNYRYKKDYSASVYISKYALQKLNSTHEDLINSFLYELSICLYYINYREKGIYISDYLKFHPKTNNKIYKSVHFNTLYYLFRIPYISLVQIDLNILESNVFPLNPSVLNLDNKYLVNCRMINYVLNDHGYHVYHPKNITITRNFLVDVDYNFNIMSYREMKNQSNHIIYDKTNQGFEDCRLFKYQGHIWFSATSWDTHVDNYAHICLGRITNDKIDTIYVLDNPYKDVHEKNWLPLVIEDQLLFIYGFNPFTIIKPDLKTRKVSTHFIKNFGKNLSSFRGGSPPIPFDNGYLLTIHEVADWDYRYYYTRFVWLSKDFNDIKITRPFYFLEKGIEFSIGLCLSHDQNEIIAGVGIYDRKSFLFRISTDMIKKLLIPL